MDLMARRRAIMGMPSGKDYTVSGNVVSISNALAKNAKSLIVSFSPKQSGSGDPSPSNVRPITGYNDIGAVRYGKNLFNKDGTDTSKGYVAGKYLDYTGNEVVPGSGSFAISEYIPILPNTSYTVSGLPTSNAWSPSICQYDSNHVYISGANYGNSATKTITAGANAACVRMSIPMGNINSLQLEYGNTATSYEPYISPVTANVHSDTTIFGGTVDLVSGECVVDRAMYTFSGGEAWTASATPHRFSTDISHLPYPIATQPMTQGATQNILTSVFGECVYTNADGVGYVVHLTNYSLFVVNESTATTVSDIKTIVTGMQFCYELATPITYQLTPSQLALLKGNNTVYSNEGSISLTYVGK